MALTDNQLALTKLYLAAFNRAPEKGGLDYWNEQLASGKPFDEVVRTVFSLDIVKAIYPDSLSTDDFLGRIYANIFGKTADADGLQYWAGQLAGGQDRSTLVLTMINAGLNTPDGTPGKAFIVNRYQSAQYTVEQQVESGIEIAIDQLSTIMAGVNADATTTSAAKSLIDTLVPKAPGISVASEIVANGINAAQSAAGLAVSVDLTGTGATAGYKIDLLLNGAAFPVPVTHVLTEAEAAANKVTITIAATSGWGLDGTKTITAQLTNLQGSAGLSDALDLVLDTGAPGAPTNETLMYRWTYDTAAQVLDTGFYQVQFKIPAGQATGGKATLQVGPTVVATDSTILSGDSMLDFVLDETGARNAYDALIPGTLTVTIYDKAGNATTANALYTPAEWVHVAPPAPTGLVLIPVGGTVVANSLNASNTNLKAQATIVAGPAIAGKAVLKIGDKVVATDGLISAGDTTVTFDVGSISSTALQGLITSGGVASVTLYDADGRTATSTENPTLLVNYSGTVASTLTAATSITLTPVGGTVVANTLNATNTDLTAQAAIVAGQATGGSAQLKLDGKVIATDSYISATDTIVTFDVGTYTTAGLQTAISAGGTVSVTLINAAGQSITSSIGNPVLTTNYTQTSTSTSTSTSQLNPTQATYTQVIDSMNSLHLTELRLTIASASTTGGSAALLLDGAIVASDTSISAGDTSIDFNLSSTTGGVGGSDKIIGNIAMGGTIKALITDASGNTSTVDVKALPTQYVGSGPTAPTNVILTPVGGTVVTDALNATNTSLLAQATIMPGQLTGGRAELRINGISVASDVSISSSDATVTFDLNGKPASGGNVTVWVTDATGMTTATSASKVLNVDYTAPSAPTAIKVAAADATGSDKVAYVTITAGQANGGSAKLLVNGQVIATDSSILANDAYVDFKLSDTVATSWLDAVSAGTSAVEIMDATGNITSMNLLNLPLQNSTSTLTGDYTAPYALGQTKSGWGFYSGDTAVLKFSESTDKAAGISSLLLSNPYNQSLTFGTGATAVWNSAGTELTITSGSGSTVNFSNLTVTVLGVKDLAGNMADVVFSF